MTKTAIQRLVFGLASALIIFSTVQVFEAGMISEPEDTLSGSEIDCVLDIDIPRRGDLLLAGYNYLLLSSFADSLGSTAHIRCSYGSGSYIDSLKRGVVDIVVLAYADSISLDSVTVCRPIDGRTVWAVRSDKPGAVTEINNWLDAAAENLDILNKKSLFIHRFDPCKAAQNGRKFHNISPYDDLIRLYAQRLGWDWRLLAALIYNETRFHIEAYSRRGACGLMQLMPSVADRFNVTNPLDPEESIRAGAEFLDKLQKRFAGDAADDDELVRFTLAAYNAGAGRIKDCISYAQYIGAEATTWEGIASAIPGMRDESVLEIDTVKLGMFQGNETVAYVRGVLSTYDAFCKICAK